MKKSILAIFLAVIAMAQVHAQDSDLRSAPDLPTFKVTLNYSSANTDQGTITSTVATGSRWHIIVNPFSRSRRSPDMSCRI